ncbi:hypothetical protein H2248_003097 [Termitomyces sp. 'cryptogamus']|nr:hypothetical protein H2248_003097 [Termitomyces sp. 'cryptogamus']
MRKLWRRPPSNGKELPGEKKVSNAGKEKEAGGIEGGKMMKRKGGWKKKPAIMQTTEEPRMGKTIAAQDHGEAVNTNEKTNGNANRFMTLEHLLNEREEMPGRWADEEMEGQERMEMTLNGNVPSI